MVIIFKTTRSTVSGSLNNINTENVKLVEFHRSTPIQQMIASHWSNLISFARRDILVWLEAISWLTVSNASASNLN